MSAPVPRNQHIELGLLTRGFATVVALFMACAMVVVALVAFYIPHNRIRRDYTQANCTVQAAEPSCSLECRIANVTSPSFPQNSTGVIARDGKGNSPCDSVALCDENFLCRFKVLETDSTGQVTLTVRSEPGRLSLGFILFVGLAGVVLLLLSVWLCADILRYCGLKSGTKVEGVVFLPPGIELAEVTRAARHRWPIVDFRGLDFSNMVTESEAGFFITVRRILSTPSREGKRGCVFVVRANGRNDMAVMEAIPQHWYRVCCLPPLQVCLGCIGASEDADLSSNGAMLSERTGGGLSERTSAAGGEQSAAEQATSPSSRATGFEERNQVLGCEMAHRELTRMSSVDAGLFDYVYSDLTVADMKNYKQLVRSLIAPVVGLRTGIISVGVKFKQTLGQFGNSSLHRCMGGRDDQGLPKVDPSTGGSNVGRASQSQK